MGYRPPEPPPLNLSGSPRVNTFAGAGPSAGSGLFGELLGAVESLAPVAAAVAGAAGAGELAAGLNAASAAAQVIDSLFHVIKLPNGRNVVIGGYQPDVDDADDVPYDAHQSVDPDRLPKAVDLRRFLSPVEEQGELGSCTANAVAGAHEYLQRRANQGRHTDVSRLFIYFLERQLEGTVDQDAGAQIRSGMKVLAKWGVCSEQLWPYDIDRYTEQPPDEAFAHAKNHLIDEYKRVPIELHAWKVCLAEGYPVVFGTDIFQSFEDDGSHGWISMPRSREKNLGGHAMLCVGYDESKRIFIVRNSWGTDWGDGGYCYFPYDYLANEEFTDDAWTLRRGENLDFSMID